MEKGERDYPTWSADNRYIYFLESVGTTPRVYRVPVIGGASERVLHLTNFRFTGTVGICFSLDPAGAPMLLRDTGSDDIYALTLEEK